MDVWQNTATVDGDTSKESVKLLIISDSKLQVSWSDTSSLVVFGSVSAQFEQFSGQIFQDSSKVDWSSATNAS